MKLSRYDQFIKESKDDINHICKGYGIKNYTINEDGSIDVNETVCLSSNRLVKIPLKFNNVYGYFDCGSNNLMSLEGCPKYVYSDFYCNNNKLSSLKGCPETISGGFYCSNNKLTTLEGCPKSVYWNFSCPNNNISSLEGFPEFFEGRVYIKNNPVYEIVNLFPVERFDKAIYWINEFEVIREGKQVILDRLEEVFIQMNLKVPNKIEFNNYEII